MPIDKVSIDASLTVSTGALFLTSRVYLNPAVAAAFSAVTGATIAPVVTVGPGNRYVTIVTTVTPDTPVGVVAESKRFVADHTNDGAGTLL